MKLRDYQEKAKEIVLKKFKKGKNKQVIVLATGTGKTIIFSSIADELIKQTGKKALIIAHREELLDQASEKLKRVNPDLKIGIEQANRYTNPKELDIIIASVPTIGRINSNRITKLNPEDFCLVIIDEAHHASASSYKTILRHLGLLKGHPKDDWNKECLLLGVTATPSRNDNQGIEQIFDQVTYTYTILEGIQDEYLSRIKAYRVNTHTDLSGVHKTAGDFNLGELGDRVNNQDRNGLVIKAYQNITPNQQALCFAVDVAHTQELCRRFLEEGIKSAFVIGTTPKEERAKLLQDFKDKKIQVMVNAMVLTEGYDNESIEVILMARPTQSGILFQQMVGRGTRIFPGKDYLTVIDFVDNTYRQNLQTTSSLLGFTGTLDFKGRDILTVKEEVDKIIELAPNYDLSKLDIDKIKYALEEVDLLSGLQIPDEIESYTQYDWFRYGEDCYRLGLANNRYIVINHEITGEYKVFDNTYDKVLRKEVGVYIGLADSLEAAIKGADYYLGKKYPDQLTLVKQTAKWRNQPLSDKQIDLLMKLRVNQSIISQLDKGKGSRLITKILNHNRLQRSYL